LAKLAQARERCKHLDSLAGHVTEFAKILTGLHGDRLDAWITAVEADDQPDLHSFVRGVKRDYDAVLNGLTMPWSSGVVEGNVNRLLRCSSARPSAERPSPCSASACSWSADEGSVIITKYGPDPHQVDKATRLCRARHLPGNPRLAPVEAPSAIHHPIDSPAEQ
jgi:hypothetical protein